MVEREGRTASARAVVQVARSAQKHRARPSAVTVSAASLTGSSSGSCRTSRRGRRGSGTQEPAAAAAMGREAATAAMGREERVRGRRGGQGRSGPRARQDGGSQRRCSYVLAPSLLLLFFFCDVLALAASC